MKYCILHHLYFVSTNLSFNMILSIYAFILSITYELSLINIYWNINFPEKLLMSLEMNISTRDVFNLELIIGFFEFFSVHNFCEQSSEESFQLTLSFCLKCWNKYTSFWQEIEMYEIHMFRLLYIRASRKVIEKRSTDFNGLEDNGTLLFKTATCWIAVYIHKNINKLITHSNKFVWKSERIFNSSKHSMFNIFKYFQLLASIKI